MMDVLNQSQYSIYTSVCIYILSRLCRYSCHDTSQMPSRHIKPTRMRNGPVLALHCGVRGCTPLGDP